MPLCLLGIAAGVLMTGLARPLSARAATDTITIEITGVSQPPGFLPALLSVHVGGTVAFLNDAIPAASYTVAATDHSFTSPSIASGQQWTTTFATAGVYDYTDPAHSAQMYGELVVVPASVALLPTPPPGAVQTAIAQDQAQLAPTPITTPTAGPHVAFPGTNLPGLSLLLIGEGLAAGLFLVGAAVVLVLRSRRSGAAKTRGKRQP
jgi:plastocyanin